MSSAKKETAYELDTSKASFPSSEPQHFGVFPGLWQVGVPIAVTDLGLTATEAAELVKQHGLPLKRTTAVPQGLLEPPADASVEEVAPQVAPETNEAGTTAGEES